MKRAIDFGTALVALTLLLPLMLVVAMAVLLSSEGPILYSSERVGRYGKRFRLLKFRSMVVGADSLGGHSTALNDSRLTPCGRFLRKWKLDELPQLLNVLIGDMSLVGPRPQVPYYADRYRGQDLEMLSVRPGITDIASLHFFDMDATLGDGDVDTRYLQEIEPIKNALRLQYVAQRSTWLDFKIVIATLLCLLRVPIQIDLGVSGSSLRDDRS